MIFVPDKNGDDVPDGPAEVKLDGFEYQRNHHTIANGLRWGISRTSGRLTCSTPTSKFFPAATKFLLHLHALKLDNRVIYDRLADTDRVPGYEWLMPSTNPDPFQREAENDEPAPPNTLIGVGSSMRGTVMV